MGQVFLAVSAAVWNFAGSAPGTLAVASRWIDFTDHPASALSKSKVAFTSIPLANDEMGIAKLVPKVPRTDCFRVGVSDPVNPHEGREQREVARHRIMEPREQAVDRVDPAVWIHEEPGKACAGPQSFGCP